MEHLEKIKKEYKSLQKETSDLYIYQNEVDKACFQQDMADWDFKDLTRRTASDKILRDEPFNIAKNPKYDGYQRGLGSMVHKLFDKKTSSRGIENKNILNKELGEESQCVIDVFSKHARVISLKKKIGMTITNAFKKILKEFNGKPNKIWLDKRKKFYNRSMKSWLETNAIKMRPTHNEGKSVIVERFIRALKNKRNKYMTSVSKICMLIN